MKGWNDNTTSIKQKISHAKEEAAWRFLWGLFLVIIPTVALTPGSLNLESRGGHCSPAGFCGQRWDLELTTVRERCRFSLQAAHKPWGEMLDQIHLLHLLYSRVLSCHNVRGRRGRMGFYHRNLRVADACCAVQGAMPVLLLVWLCQIETLVVATQTVGVHTQQCAGHINFPSIRVSQLQ
jgi:hypothetical protein